MKDRWTVTVAAAMAALVAAGAGAENETTIEITDKVLVQDTIPFGINAPGPSWKRHVENFEGTMYRTITRGPVQDGKGLACWWDMEEALIGADFVVLNGPARGHRGKIRAVSTMKIEDGRTITYLVFDREVPPSPPRSETAIMMERRALDRGFVAVEPGKNRPHQGDTPPGSFGHTAMRLLGAAGRGVWSRRMGGAPGPAGVQRLRFWAKALGAPATLHVSLRGEDLPPLDVVQRWEQYSVEVPADGEDGGHVRLSSEGVDVLVDDLEWWMDRESSYPKCHVEDAFVDVLRRIKPGIVRALQTGGNTLGNMIQPPLRQYAYDYRFDREGRRQGYGLAGGGGIVGYYSLCEAVGADPWQCLPGTIYPEEMTRFIEFIAAPPTDGLGRLRAEQGHPEPYTSAFRRIYVEIGNEAWNPTGGYARGGFNGPQYWHALFEAALASPHYKPNIVLVAGTQQHNLGLTRRILTDHPQAHAASIATYIVHQITPDWLEPLKTDDARFRWLFGYTIDSVTHPDPRVGYVCGQASLCREFGKELTIYEHNYHMTKPTEERGGVPTEERDMLMVSIGGALNNVNHMLMAMKEAHVRAQCFFTLRQNYFAGVKLWGALESTYAATPRPVYYALGVCNEAIGGDLVATLQRGANPTFSATGVLPQNRRAPKITTSHGYRTLWSYAFRDGAHRGLILVNLDTAASHRVRIVFPDAVRSGKAACARLTADRITANNERDYVGSEPQVGPPHREVLAFASGRVLDLPPHSLVSLRWRAQTPERN
jgi:hypothetical protein